MKPTDLMIRGAHTAPSGLPAMRGDVVACPPSTGSAELRAIEQAIEQAKRQDNGQHHRKPELGTIVPMDKQMPAAKGFRHMLALHREYHEVRMEDSIQERTFVAWRITREMIRLRGWATFERQPLSALPLERWMSGAPWTWPRDSSVHAAVRQHARYVLAEKPHIALMPPWPISIDNPGGWLIDWIELVESMCDYLPLTAPIKKIVNTRKGKPSYGIDEMAGHKGLKFLKYPATARLSFPHPAEIVYLEQQLVMEVTKYVALTSIPKAVQRMCEHYGLAAEEARTLTSLATMTMAEDSARSLEENRAIFIARLEAFIRRCRNSAYVDLRAELAAIKAIATVQGLTQVDTKDGGMKDLIDAINQVNNERDELDTIEGEASEIE